MQADEVLTQAEEQATLQEELKIEESYFKVDPAETRIGTRIEGSSYWVKSVLIQCNVMLGMTSIAEAHFRAVK